MMAELAESVKLKSGKSILGLKSVFGVKKDNAESAGEIAEDAEEEEEVEAVADDSKDSKKMAQKLLLKAKLSKLKSTRKHATSQKVMYEFK